jgi:hypothetical protein
MKRLYAALIMLLMVAVPTSWATVPDSTSKSIQNCNGSATAFPFTFGIGATSEVKITQTTSAGVASVLAETTEYSVSCTNNDCSAGGTVTTVNTCPSGSTITIERNVPYTQEADFTEGMPTLYETFEDGLDKLTRIAQQQRAMIASIVAGTSTSTHYYQLLSDYGSITDAVSAVGGISATLLCDAPINLGSNTNITANINFVAVRGCLITTTGYTLTFTGNLQAGLYQIFTGTGTVTGLKESRPEWFGASPSASAATNVTAFQAAINSLAVTAYTPAYDASTGWVEISQGLYQINDKLTILPYTKIRANGQVIIESTDVTKDIIYSQHPYHNEINGITFIGGKSHINLMNGTDHDAGVDGLEGVMTKIKNCYFAHSADYAIKLARNATNGGNMATIEDSLAFDNAQFLYAFELDGVSINRVWLEPTKAHTADNTAQIVNYSSNMAVYRLITAHANFDDPTNNRWFDNYGFQLTIDNSRFGAESGGGLPIVYNFTDALNNAVYPYLTSNISITNSMTYAGGGGGTDGGAIVLKSGMPNTINFINNTGLAVLPIINTAVMTGAVAFSTYMAGIHEDYHPLLNVNIQGNAQWNTYIASTDADTALLMPWVNASLMYHLTESTHYGLPVGNINKMGNLQVTNLMSTNIYGTSYPTTSVSPAAPNDTISIVDTGITATPGQSFMVNIVGTPNNAGDSANRDVAVGILTVIYNTGAASIVFTPIIAAATLTVTPTISSGQIRISVGAYTAGEAGYNQVVRIARLL